MIYKNNNAINEWYFNDAELIKVYKNGAICYYKIVQGATPSQEPCFAVVEDITQYSDTEFVDVYDKATDKWYKLNNLDQYEEYGIYGSGRTITYYEGKLTIDSGYEYEWDGSEWSNIGEVSGSSRVPQGYTEVGYISSENSSSSSSGGAINTGVLLYSANNNSYEIAGKVTPIFTNGWGDNQTFINIENKQNPYTGMVWRFNTSGGYKFDTNPSNNATLATTVNTDGSTTFTITSQSTGAAHNTPLGLFAAWQSSLTPYRFCKMRVYSMEITLNGTLVRDFVPATRNSDSKAGLYDVVNDVFYTSVNNFNFTAVGGGGSIVYPKYYTEKDEPENNVVFEDMEEALAYECPWVGMDVTIDNTPYLFGDAYEWLTKYGLFEVSGEYICYSGDKYEKMEEMVRNVDGTWSSQIPAVYEKGDLIEAGSPDCSHSLPDVPFMLNYNAKNYDATNRKLPKTEGQLRDSDAVCNYGYHIVDHSADGYITVTGDTRMIISGTPYMNRNNTQTGCTMTIVSKVKTTNASNSYSILTNRNNNMNWMWRYPSNGIFLHGSSSYNNPKYLVSTTGQPITASIRISYDGSVKQQLNDWTNNGSYNGAFQYGSESTGNSAMFCDYTTSNSEFWQGDFYWVYMSFNVLTDEQIQQVIDYNENL